ncbi:MAG TPA: uroporphyrinogen decarboxylase family protein [Armatimonadota bacterium]
MKAFAHQTPDRTPLFEIFCAFHPIYWDICGRNAATDAILYWDALAEGITWEELVDLQVDAVFQVHKFFDVDIVRPAGTPGQDLPRPEKTGPLTWRQDGLDYVYNEHSNLVDPVIPVSYTHQKSEEATRKMIEEWEPTPWTPPDPEAFEVYRRVRVRAEAEGLDWLYMAEIGAGTGAAFYPPFMLMWLIAEPELFQRWLDIQKAGGFPYTAHLIEQGMELVAMGGDVSCDKGPFISPKHYHEFLLPVLQEHVNLIHEHGAKAIYTSDGNHWAIAQDFFFGTGVDGYKEVDQAAGMTWPRLIEAGIDKQVCILGNTDARYSLCLGTPEEVKTEVRQSLDYGRQSPGGHILHNSHSVHEDVRVENYYAVIEAYREYFGLEPLPR